jgi:hypothetical protein
MVGLLVESKPSALRGLYFLELTWAAVFYKALSTITVQSLTLFLSASPILSQSPLLLVAPRLAEYSDELGHLQV